MSKARLFDAIRRLDVAEMRRLLDAQPALRAAVDRKGFNLLHLACCVPASTRMVDFLLDRGFDLESAVGADRCTPLFFAVARARDPKLVRYLLRRGSSPANAPGGGLFAAGWYGDVENLELLIRAGAEVDVVVGWTPFLAAWNLKHFDAARCLVRHGADPNFQDPKSGRTALHYGVEKAFDPAQLKWLVRHGASPDISNRKGMTAREQAARKRDKRWLDALAGPDGAQDLQAAPLAVRNPAKRSL